MRNSTARKNQLTHLAEMLWVRPILPVEVPKAKNEDKIAAAIAHLEERTRLALRRAPILVP